MKTKRCSKCKERKPISEFYSDKSHKDKLDNYCKECKKAKNNRDYKNDPEKFRARVKKWRANHSKKIKET